MTISNTSSEAATQLALTASAGFALTANTCGTSLGAGASCSVGVVFSAHGYRGGDRHVERCFARDYCNQANVTLSGAGALAAAVQVTPATISFPVTGAGQTSSATTVTVTNTGLADALTDLTLTVGFGGISSGERHLRWHARAGIELHG